MLQVCAAILVCTMIGAIDVIELPSTLNMNPD